VNLYLYSDWKQIRPAAKKHVDNADVAIATSYCADGVSACDLILGSRAPRKVFYDMDTPVTLSRLLRGETVEYLPAQGLEGFDLVLSYTGGEALHQLRDLLHARRVAALYGWVDPSIHHPVAPVHEYLADLSYLGTYAADRQRSLENLLLGPACESPDMRFVIGGPMYPNTAQWPANVSYKPHVPPSEHSSFYCSSRLTLNITRASMAAMGYCPSGRLFEAAACGTPVLSDWWTGLDEFFQPGEEILIAASPSDTLNAIRQDARSMKQVGARARQRALDSHTAEIRARQFVDLVFEDAAVMETPFENPAYLNRGG
jgi:spore maturation protein CgeB